MTAMLNSLPQPPAGHAEQIATLVESDLSADVVRAKIIDAQRVTSEHYRQYLQVLDQISEGMIGLLKDGAQIDVDNLIDSFLEVERHADRQRALSEEQLNDTLRIAAKKRPDLLRVLNEAAAAELADIDRFASANRDARWRLMKARALYQPSKGVGAIKGQHTDLDSLVKN